MIVLIEHKRDVFLRNNGTSIIYELLPLSLTMPLPHDIEAGFPVNIPGSSGSIHQQSELPQNAEAGQPQSLHDGLYSAILNCSTLSVPGFDPV